MEEDKRPTIEEDSKCKMRRLEQTWDKILGILEIRKVKYQGFKESYLIEMCRNGATRL